MFNKPALFPKSPEPVQARGVRPANSLAAAGPSSVTNAAPAGGVVNTQREAAASVESLVEPQRQPDAGAAPQDSGSRLIVGPDVKLKGAEILDCDTLVVEGRVEATMDSRVIRIAEKGAFSGTVCIDVAEIHGSFDGELTAREQLIIHATGRVSGKIRYGKILIEAGGEVSGDVQSMSAKAGGVLRGDKPVGLESKPLAAVAG